MKQFLYRLLFCRILGRHQVAWNKLDDFRGGIRGYRPYCCNCGELLR